MYIHECGKPGKQKFHCTSAHDAQRARCMQASTTELLAPLAAGLSNLKSLALGPDGTIPEGFNGKRDPKYD